LETLIIQEKTVNNNLINYSYEIAKKNISEKLMKALHDESITTNGCGKLLGVNPASISMIKNPKLWGKCPTSAWEAVLKWVNSGQRLQEYGEKHGRVADEINASDIKSDPKLLKEAEKIKTKNEIEALNKNIKEEPEKKFSDPVAGALRQQSVDAVKEEQKKGRTELRDEKLLVMLLGEKESLKQKLDAVDYLIKLYTS